MALKLDLRAAFGRLIAFVVTSSDLQVIDVAIPEDRLRDTVAAAAASVRDRRDRQALERAWSLMIEPLSA